MQEKFYDLNNLLNTIFITKNNNVNRRLIYDKSPLKRVGSSWIKALFIMMPFAMYAAIFNPISFEYLGIAQAIVFYIILLVFAMQIIIGVSFFNNRSAVKAIQPSWEHYFPNVELKMILSRGVTPYIDFPKHYKALLSENLDNVSLHKNLESAFIQMENENKILVDAINRDKRNKEGK